MSMNKVIIEIEKEGVIQYVAKAESFVRYSKTPQNAQHYSPTRAAYIAERLSFKNPVIKPVVQELEKQPNSEITSLDDVNMKTIREFYPHHDKSTKWLMQRFGFSRKITVAIKKFCVKEFGS